MCEGFYNTNILSLFDLVCKSIVIKIWIPAKLLWFTGIYIFHKNTTYYVVSQVHSIRSLYDSYIQAVMPVRSTSLLHFHKRYFYWIIIPIHCKASHFYLLNSVRGHNQHWTYWRDSYHHPLIYHHLLLSLCIARLLTIIEPAGKHHLYNNASKLKNKPTRSWVLCNALKKRFTKKEIINGICHEGAGGLACH